jgi:uncharacterized membrane protein YbjE (DUF340 family)
MSQLLSLLSLVVALAAGMLLGRLRAAKALRSSPSFLAVRTGVLFALIFTMGFRMGRTREVLESFSSLGIASLGFSLSTLAGTLVVLWALFSIRLLLRRGRENSTPNKSARATGAGILRALKDPLTLLTILAAGFMSGIFVPFFPYWNGSLLISIVLYALLLVIGVGLVGSGVKAADILAHPDLILLPVGTALGSLAGGAAAGIVLSIPLGTSLAISSGFGWYSLSGVILTRLDGPLTGSIAFLTNMLRESMALLLIPLLSRTRFPHLAIGAGGATAMDVTLPLIEKNCGPRSVGFAMASGAALSLAVPILVPLFAQTGS